MARKKHPMKSDPGHRQQRNARAPNRRSTDYLVDAAEEHRPHLLMMYRRFEDKKPVLLLDLQEQRIYAYPYREFKNDLSERSQRSLEEQYEKAVRENQLVVFVRDNVRRRLVSFSIAAE